MPHMQAASDIGRRDHDAVGGIALLRCKCVHFFPALINRLLDLGGQILAIQRVSHGVLSVRVRLGNDKAELYCSHRIDSAIIE